MNVTTGGSWHYIMHGPDGRDYPNRIHFIEVVRPERLVYQLSGDENTEPVSFRVIISFEEEGKKTRVTMHMIFPSAEELKRV